MASTIHIGDCREVLKSMPDRSVNCCVTSPPYFGLRDYGVDRQIGLESSPAEFVQIMVDVFREVRRVLREDGTLWLNLGDSYSSSGRGGNPTGETSGLQGGQASQRASMISRARGRQGATGQRANRRYTSQISAFKASDSRPKNLMGMPWRVAFALQADGWYLRQDIIWAKPNPMPESVRDRCTKAHEYLFLLSKSERYYFDADAIAEPLGESSIERLSQSTLADQSGSDRVPGKTNGPMKVVGRRRAPGNVNPQKGAIAYANGAEEHRTKAGLNAFAEKERTRVANGELTGTRNKRSVWTVTTQPFKEAHFATFPPALAEPCILAGCPWGGIVLDPFGGAGTTALVAERLQRDSILIELNPEYAAMTERRIRNDAPMLADVRIACAP